jgi:PKD repeat protein
VTLRVTNSLTTNTLTKSAYITITTNPPVTLFTASPTTGRRTLTVNFTDTSTYRPTRWSWNFGDNTTSTSQNPSHSYRNAGTYTVKLVTTNAYGSSSLVKLRYITVTN